jgi:hypothetical protein
VRRSSFWSVEDPVPGVGVLGGRTNARAAGSGVWKAWEELEMMRHVAKVKMRAAALVLLVVARAAGAATRTTSSGTADGEPAGERIV